MPAFILGKDAKLYIGTAGPPADAIGAMTEVTIVRDLTMNLEAGEADITTRGNSGWKATAPALREATLDFEILWNPEDANFNIIRNAFLNVGDVNIVEFAALDQDRSVSGAQGIKASFSITSFSRSEPLEEALTVSVTAKLHTFDQWLEV